MDTNCKARGQLSDLLLRFRMLVLVLEDDFLELEAELLVDLVHRVWDRLVAVQTELWKRSRKIFKGLRLARLPVACVMQCHKHRVNGGAVVRVAAFGVRWSWSRKRQSQVFQLWKLSTMLFLDTNLFNTVIYFACMQIGPHTFTTIIISHFSSTCHLITQVLNCDSAAFKFPSIL